MREIKFRAWDKEGKRWLDISYLFLDNTGKVIGYTVKGETWTIDKVELVEYTGLKDKNGKEIYEGDIFKITVPPCETNQVVFDDGEYKLVDHGLSLSEYTSHGEVIGNTQENKDLLESDK